MSQSPEILLLTLQLQSAEQERFEQLRRQHFPGDRNVVPAHISLFHNLPGGELPAITERLNQVRARPAFALDVQGVKSMGRGVMYVLKSADLLSIHRALSTSWHDWLIPQDRQPYHPHIVVQNKVPAEVARATCALLEEAFEPFAVRAEALLLWEYLGGPWKLVEAFEFESSQHGQT